MSRVNWVNRVSWVSKVSWINRSPLYEALNYSAGIGFHAARDVN